MSLVIGVSIGIEERVLETIISSIVNTTQSIAAKMILREFKLP